MPDTVVYAAPGMPWQGSASGIRNWAGPPVRLGCAAGFSAALETNDTEVLQDLDLCLFSWNLHTSEIFFFLSV